MQFNSFVAIFKQSYLNRFKCLGELKYYLNDQEKLKNLEDTLFYVVRTTFGYNIDNKYEMARVKYLFDDIVNNLAVGAPYSLTQQINKYASEVGATYDSHPYVNLLLKVLSRIYSPDYDGKPGNYNNAEYASNARQYTHHYYTSISFGLITRRGDGELPIIQIKNIDELEDAIQEYIDTVRVSDSFYNKLNDEAWKDSYNEEEIVMMLLEGTLLNISYDDANDLATFFKRYTDFIKHYGLGKLLKKEERMLGEGLNIGLDKASEDEEKYNLCAFIKRSDMEYETPYYLSINCFNNNHVIELPNVRFGIAREEDGHLRAYILATQSSQSNASNPYCNPDLIAVHSSEIKKRIPKTSKYRFYNPNHLVSILITYGMLKGLGVVDIQVVPKMPLRCYKTICDKGYNGEEEKKYLQRVTEKNVCTYEKAMAIVDGIQLVEEITDSTLRVAIDNDLKSDSEYINNLIAMGYDFGLRNREENRNLD